MENIKILKRVSNAVAFEEQRLHSKLGSVKAERQTKKQRRHTLCSFFWGSSLCLSDR